MKQTITWDDAALVRIQKIPFFIRGFAKRKLEKAAIDRQTYHVTVALLDEIKQKEMAV